MKCLGPGYMPPASTPFPPPNSLIGGQTWAEHLTWFCLAGPADIFWSSNIILYKSHSIWFSLFYTLNSEDKTSPPKTKKTLLSVRFFTSLAIAPDYLSTQILVQGSQFHPQFISSISAHDSFYPLHTHQIRINAVLQSYFCILFGTRHVFISIC